MVEKTGYPQDMLDVDLDLEADLGVDTVKQAEMFAAIREIYNIPRDENRKLRDYPTLAHVIRFVYEKRPDLAGAAPLPRRPRYRQPAPAPVATQPTPPAPAVASPADGAGDSVKERILELMVEKTGYPKDMLDLDLDLEADLGVDTVKQAEMFAAIREIYNIPRDENRKLRDYPTLAHVIRFVYEKRPDLAGGLLRRRDGRGTARATSAAVVTHRRQQLRSVTTPANGADDSVKERILELMVEKTGYPKDMLDLDLDLEADLGVDTVKQAEMFAAIREIYNIPRDENRKLRDYPTLAHVIRFVYEKRPDLAGAAPVIAHAAVEPNVPGPPSRRSCQRSQTSPSRTKCWRSWPRRPATPRTCSTWTSIWKPTSALTRSSRRRCSRPYGPHTTFRAMRISSCVIPDFGPCNPICARQTAGSRNCPHRNCCNICSVGCDPRRAAPARRQLRRGEPHSASRAGTRPASAAHLCKPTGSERSGRVAAS